MPSMRTTLDIADDVLSVVKDRAQREHRSEGEVLTDLARRGLGQGRELELPAEPESFYGFKPFPRRGAPVSNEMIDRLREEEPI